MAEEPMGATEHLQNKHPKQRVIWVDFIRVFVMLWIICMHGGYVYGMARVLGTIFCSPTVLIFFFFSAILLKKNATVWKRGLLILGVFALWSFLLSFGVFPVARYVSGIIQMKTPLFSLPDMDWAWLSQMLLPDIRELWPTYGPMWFLRALGLYTLATPLLARINKHILLGLCIALTIWGLVLAIGWIECGLDIWLPFFLNSDMGVLSFAYFLIGLWIMKSGGIHRLSTRLDSLPYFILAVPFLASITLYIASKTGLLPLNYLFGSKHALIWTPVSAACLLSLGSIIHKVEREDGHLLARIGKRANKFTKWVAALAPCVFSVYILHWAFIAIEHAIYNTWLSRYLDIPCIRDVYVFIRPVAVFAMSYAAFMLLRKVPKCSRILCFVAAPQQNGK